MRWLFRLLGVVVSLAVLAGLALFVIPTERIAALVAQRIEAETGRAITIEGAVRPSIFPMIGVRLERVSLANAQWSAAGPMLRADVLDVGIDVAALWAGEVVVQRLELRAPQILLERNAAMQENWVLEGRSPVARATGTAPRAVPDTAPRGFVLELAEVSDGRLRFIDHGAGVDVSITDLSAELRLPGLERPAQLRANGRMRGQPFSVQASVAQPGALLDGRISALALTADAAGASLRFDGRAGLVPLAFEGRADIAVPTLTPVLAMLGQTGADMPRGLLPVEFAGQLTRSAEGSLHARDARLRLGDNRLGGAADLRIGGARPHLTAQLSAEALDLRPILGAPQAAPGAGRAAPPAAGGWSAAPLNLAALGALDADITLAAGRVDAGTLRLGATRLGLGIDNARAVFDLRELRLFDGTLTGELVLNGRGGGSVGGNLRLVDVALLPLLRDLAGFERLHGRGSGQMRFLGAGDSMLAIMSSLSGEGRIDLGAGEIHGIDLAGLLQRLDLSLIGEGARTGYERIEGSFTIAGGVLRNEDLRLHAPQLSVAGRGTVGIGERVLNYRVTPEAMRDPQTGQVLRVPLLITGPWDAPRFRLDLEALAQERLREEAARLEDLARQEARRREEDLRARAERELQERLGTGAQQGQSLEDAARRLLEQEIGRGLDRLLGRN